MRHGILRGCIEMNFEMNFTRSSLCSGIRAGFNELEWRKFSLIRLRSRKVDFGTPIVPKRARIFLHANSMDSVFLCINFTFPRLRPHFPSFRRLISAIRALALALDFSLSQIRRSVLVVVPIFWALVEDTPPRNFPFYSRLEVAGK